MTDPRVTVITDTLDLVAAEMPWTTQEAREALDSFVAERAKLREALEVGLVCMCESCVERVNLLLLEGDEE